MAGQISIYVYNVTFERRFIRSFDSCAYELASKNIPCVGLGVLDRILRRTEILK